MWVLFPIILMFRMWHINGDCNVISKSQWDGLPATHQEYLIRPLDLVIIEHTATPTCSSEKTCTELVRSIQDNHIDALKYWDIGYNFLIGGDGKVYEGTGWLKVGAHTYGYNRRSLGIAFIGNFNNDDPAPAAIETVKSLIKCGVEKGHLKSSYKVVAHRQLIATESPGRKLYAIVRRWPDWLEDTSSLKKI